MPALPWFLLTLMACQPGAGPTLETAPLNARSGAVK